MFAAVHQEQQQQQEEQQKRPQRRHVDDDSPSVISTSAESGFLPGAYAEGGRSGRDGTDDTYTLTPEESVALVQERRDPNEGLPMLSAVAVDDDDENNHPPEDNTPVFEAEEKEETSWISERRNQYFLSAFILLLIGIVVTVVLLVTGRDDGGGGTSNLENNPPRDDDSEILSEATQTPSSQPSASPAPTSFFDRIFGLIAAYSGEELLLDSSTPQSQAFQWTLGDFEAGGWSDDVILQRYALGSLFYSTDGLRWLTVTDFLLQLPYCEWDGVGCTNGTLTALSLPSENLVGTVPREIGMLTYLTSLDMSGNSLSGALPTEIGFLTDLKEIDVSHDLDTSFRAASTSLQGSIPSEIGLLTSLLTLDLSGNSLSGSIPSEFGQLKDIRNLSLQRNLLEGAIPLQLGFLTSLVRVSLEMNLLSGGVPNALCSSITMINQLSSDCLAEVDGDKPAEVVCKCCNICCDMKDVCKDLDVTAFPSASPSTLVPSTEPSSTPTNTPSTAPSSLPSTSPSSIPSQAPSFVPSMSPTFNPTPSGTPQPTDTASQSSPTTNPTRESTPNPTPNPTHQPTKSPTSDPFNEMLAFAETISSSSSLSNTNSPQYKAVEWLAQDKVENGSNWSGYELLQRYVLRVLYHSTDGENWTATARTNFFGASSVCDWGSTNAQCNGNGQQVDAIDLGFDKLQGEIPDELGQLTALTILDLNSNRLTGTIPSQLGKLTALTELWLYVNQLTGTIPLQLGLLTALTHWTRKSSSDHPTTFAHFTSQTRKKQMPTPRYIVKLVTLVFSALVNNATNVIACESFAAATLPQLAKTPL